MRVLVTGAGGFVGLNVAEALCSAGDSITALDRRPLPADAERVLREHGSQFDVATGDVRDYGFIRRIVDDFAVTHIIHAAAITADADREKREPQDIIDVNLLGTVNVIDVAKRRGCARVVYVGSGQAYGATHREGRLLREDVSASRPEDLYGITKFAAEQAALRLGTLYDLDVICVRLGTVCGPWEFGTGARDVLSSYLQVAQMAVAGKTALIPERGIWRDYVYSRDVAAGLVAVLRAAAPQHRFYHLSSGVDWRGALRSWCADLVKAYPKFSWRVASVGEEPNVTYHATHDRAPMDVSRIAEDIGFRAHFGPSEARHDYLEWIRGHEDFIASPDV